MSESFSMTSVPMQVVPRSAIPTLQSVVVEGKTYDLGQLLDFRKHPSLASFIPEQARISMSWVCLKKGEVLETHQHPTSSLIIVCEGQGEVRGDCQQSLHTGDMVLVPPNHHHGFIGTGEDGFWGLSIQFEGLGLYEHPESPRVHFEDKASGQHEGFDLLLEEQKMFEKKFMRHPLMSLAKSPKLANVEVKIRLLEALNYWSDWFQKIISARLASGGKPEFFDIAEQHLEEELGHNKILYNMRHNEPVTLWDPLLDSAASWFYSQMLSATDEEKTVLIHFVLEGASTHFHTLAKPLFPDSEHFQIHSIADIEHFEMGCRLLKKVPTAEFDHLRITLRHGWAVFEVIASQMAQYALGPSSRRRSS